MYTNLIKEEQLMLKINIKKDWQGKKNLIVVDVSAVMRTKYVKLYTKDELFAMGAKARYVRQLSYFVNDEQVNTSAMYGLLQVMDMYGIDNDYIFCFDSPNNLLKKIDANYKSNRVSMGNEYFDQVNTMYKWLTDVGFRTMILGGYEGDHHIAKAVYDNKANYDNIAVVTNDKDLSALVDDNVYWIDTIKKRTDISKDNYEEVLKCPYNSVYLMKAMVGDNSDNIKGITRFGHKKFLTFLEKENIVPSSIFSNEYDIINNATTLKEEQKAEALHCLRLIVPLVINDESVRSDAVPTNKINIMAHKSFLQKYGMKSLDKKFVATNFL